MLVLIRQYEIPKKHGLLALEIESFLFVVIFQNL